MISEPALRNGEAGVAAAAQSAAPRGLQGFVFALFFIFGGVTSLNDVVIPKLKALFTLSYGEALLVQTAFFGAYFIVSIPAAMLVGRVGYLRGAALGLLTMMAGCLLFIPAAQSAAFPFFLLALFVLASGVTLVQVVANPLISTLGRPETVHARLTFAQAFNSLGTTVLPYVGALLILGPLAHGREVGRLTGQALAAFRRIESGAVVRAYTELAAVLALAALAVWTQRGKLPVVRAEQRNPLHAFAILGRPRVAFGAACIFLYVGAEVAVGSLLVGYLSQPDALALTVAQAGRMVPFYWGGAMIGRFLGAGVLRRTSPGLVLAGAAVAAMGLLLMSGTTHGLTCGYALLAVGFCNSIMFPTVFSLACEELDVQAAADASGVICVAIVGGAVLPPLAGHVADQFGLRAALLVPAACYAAILAFGLYAKARREPAARQAA